MGVIVAPHGIKGEVRIKAFTENPLNMQNYGVPVDENGTPFVLSNLRTGPKGILLAQVKDVTDRNQAETLRNTYLFAPLENLPALEEGELYVTELDGMGLIDPDGLTLGTVVDSFENGAHTVLVVQTAEGKKVYVPYIDDVVTDIDRENKTIYVSKFTEQFFTL